MFEMSKGFTLTELIIIFSIISVISILGIAGFSSYNQVQTLESAASEFVNTLNLAKSRALSQIKEPCSASQTLDGYNVQVLISSNSYALNVECSGGSTNVYVKRLPKNISFDQSSKNVFSFPILKGGAREAGQVIILGHGRQKVIDISSLGIIDIQ
jgi:type II secretory pathway pseudopilin PulG